MQAQTCQLSRFCRESQNFLSLLTVSRQGSQTNGFLGKSGFPKWNKLICWIKMESFRGMLVPLSGKLIEKNTVLITLLYRAVIFAGVQWLVLRVCLPIGKGNRPWEWGWCLVPSMEKGFDRGLKNRISLFFVESPDFFHGSPDFPLPGVGRSASRKRNHFLAWWGGGGGGGEGNFQIKRMGALVVPIRGSKNFLPLRVFSLITWTVGASTVPF